MAIVALSRVNLKDSIGDLGDRYNVAIQSCVIADSEWHIEGEYTNGTLGDVSIYRNVSREESPNWQWYGAIPAANIKSYSLFTPPAPKALPSNEPQATHQAAKSATGAAKQ